MPFREWGRLVRSDLERYFGTAFRRAEKKIHKPKIVLESFFFKAGFHAAFLYRLSHLLYRIGWSYAAWFVQRLNVTLTGAEIEYNVQIGPGLLIAHPVGIVIGRGTRAGKNLTLYQNVTLGARHMDPVRVFQFPQIEDDVTIFAGAVVAGAVRVGSSSLIGANAVVLSDVPPGSMAAGVPARIFERKPEESLP